MIEWIILNKSWIFSGIGVLVISLLFSHKWNKKKNPLSEIDNSHPVTISNQNIINNGVPNESAFKPADKVNKTVDLDTLKAKIHVLFIDDQKFKVVNILKNSGWVYTQRTSDVGSIDMMLIQQAHILFVDIQGVGRKLEFHDEGLGLAHAIKQKYPAKKVVIYSTQTQGERFHNALREADDFLPKNADPYEFQQVTERLAREIQIDL
jgi:hypothetical protein